MDFAAVLKAVDELANKHDLRYALVGGLGLAAYGIVRMTLDIDFIVERAAQDVVVEQIEQLGFETLYRSEGYSNHVHEDPQWGRVDFVYVDGKTADQIFAGAKVFEGPQGLPILVPRAEHLIAMKVLAIKNDASRTLQELADIGALITTGGLDMNEIRQYFVLHGLEERLEEIIRTL